MIPDFVTFIGFDWFWPISGPSVPSSVSGIILLDGKIECIA